MRALAAQSLRTLAENELSAPAPAPESTSEVVQRLKACLSIAVAVDGGSSPNLFKRQVHAAQGPWSSLTGCVTLLADTAACSPRPVYC